MKIAEHLSHYRIIRKLGAGAMGEVYLAKDTRLDRSVALKILPPDVADNEERLSRFVREAKAASALSHANVAHIYEIGEAEGFHFIAMEYVEGQTLATKLEGKPVSVTRILDIGNQVADALDEAHSKGIIHRDIKPANLMLTPREQIKVLDFGLAKMTGMQQEASDSDAPTQVKTGAGVVLGTIRYMSPEQALGGDLDSRSDIFSLGIVLYELSAGQPPFSGTTPFETIDQINHSQPEAIARFNYDAPAELERIILKCLEKDPNRRYQSARELRVDLENLKRDRESGSVVSTTVLRKPSRWTYAVFVLALIALAVAGVYYFSGSTERIDSLAVLPFENAGTDPDMEYLGDGITETIISSLSQLPGIKVISSASSLRYKGRDVDPETAGRELGVEAVVLGRIVPRGDEIAISAELVNARDNTQIWGEQYQRNLADLYAVQEEMAAEISHALRIRLSGEDEARLKGRHSENAEAYQAYLKGRFYWNKRTEEGFQQAIDYFQEAIERDPGYALAYTGMADSYTLLAFYHLPPKEVYPKAKAAAIKALEIDETLAEAHASLGFIRFFFDWTFPEAELELQRAIELNPTYATAHQWYSAYLAAMGRFDEAVDEIRVALELDPLSLIINADFGFFLIAAGYYDEAIEQLMKTLEMDPSFASTHWYLGNVYLRKGMYEEAIQHYQRLAELREGWLGHLGYAYAISGRRKEALSVLERLQELSEQRRVSPTEMAMVYAGLSERTRAFEYLEAVVDRDAMLLHIRHLPYSDTLKTDPRYTDLLRRIGLEP